MEDKRFEKITIDHKPEDFEGWIAFADPYGHHHIIPQQPRHLHVISTACWCGPFLEMQDAGRETWAHNQVH